LADLLIPLSFDRLAVESPVPPKPMHQEARLADPPSPEDHHQAAVLGRGIQLLQLLVSIHKLKDHAGYDRGLFDACQA
jgi:hypothetical protein